MAMTEPSNTLPDEKRPSSELIAELKRLRRKKETGAGDYPSVADRTSSENARLAELELILKRRGHL